MVKLDKQFKITSQLPVQKSVEKDTGVKVNDDGTLSLVGVASTTSQDLHGDIITSDCINSMKEQAIELNIHADHIYDIDDVIGTITNVVPREDDVLEIEFNIIPSVAPKIKELLDAGVKLGLSIGGTVKDYETNLNEENEVLGWKITKINLYEISLTPLPANWDTYGTVTSKGIAEAKCLTGACALIRKNLKDTEEANELETLKKEVETLKDELEEKESETDSEVEIQNESEVNEENMAEELTEEKVISIFTEMSENLKEEILSTVQSEIVDAVKSEVVKEQRVAFENFKEEILNIIDEALNKADEEPVEDEEAEAEEVVEESVEEPVIEENMETETETESASEIKDMLDEVKSLIKANTIDIESIKETVKEEVENNLFKELTETRTPEAHQVEAPTVQKDVPLRERKLSRKDLAKKLANEKSNNPFDNILRQIQSEAQE